uniref:DUF2442 domain-containing protein n=1 Tax=Candidatus Kentrum sp. FM TaxID=2126340 RepID=A0A450U3C9_9GAMM|nr:MAG: Protein of unknown function (DUF2442) [Candidatus Kentron sp. FM]VFJ77636.1 MAG: Protein of unknown function (DUF2442) [Candidatus Kentron sp. FM]VFK24480.1 MAG: Protein of unknown function (DUF2442) [Candidatus Kentron sp. FM]
MHTSAIKIETQEIKAPEAENVLLTEDTLTVDLSDGRTISVPLAWYPRLVYASQSERENWRLIGKGYGIHWEGIDEDISVEGLLAGKPSGESQTSFKNWLTSHASSHTYKSEHYISMNAQQTARPDAQ